YPFGDERVVESDLRAMAATGVNTVRVYEPPPRSFLDLAADCELRVLVGTPWPQHVTFLDTRARQNSIELSVRGSVRSRAGPPAVLGYVVGNEIPPGIVRWHGRRAVESFIERLYRAAKEEDAGALVSYSNFPSTEYLHLPFLDFVAFNVFLEEP